MLPYFLVQFSGSTVAAADRLAAYEVRIQQAEHTLANLALQQQALIDGTDEASLKKLLLNFDMIWNAMPSRHQKRVLQLLIRQIDYDGATSKVSITFHQHGFNALAEALAQQDSST